MPTLKERVDKHDREIAAIRKLLMTGMKMLVRIEGRIDALVADQAALKKEVRGLTTTVDRFIKSLERGGGNGRGKSQIH